MGQKRISDDIPSDREINTGYEGFVTALPDGRYQINVLINGAHCAGCIQKIESALSSEIDIEEARLNLSTHRLYIRWHGDVARVNAFITKTQKLGYGVMPYSADAQKDGIQEQLKFLLICLGIAGFAMGNLMSVSIVLWSSGATMGEGARALMHWVSAAIALPAILFAGRPFFRSALGALKNGHTNMDVPISIALILASSMSLYETIHHGEHIYFDSAVMLMFFLLIGRYLDYRARGAAMSSATDLLSTLSGFAQVIREGKLIRIPIRDVREGMLIQVASGEKFPVDGTVENGQSSVDTSLVTGETIPVDIKAGSNIYAGTMNISAPVTIIAAKAAEDSLLADIVRLMEKAAQGQAQYVRLADRAARLYTPVVHTMALLAFLGWWLIGGIAIQEALMIAVTVLIITCPCALGLAVPVVHVLASSLLMKKGVLVKSGDALERLAEIDTALMDKTGTLTIGKPQLLSYPDDHSLKLAASIARHSRHPLSQSISAAYDGALYDDIDHVEEVAGKGLQGIRRGKYIRLGNRAWCNQKDQDVSTDIEIWLDVEGETTSRFCFKDQLRHDTKSTIELLREDRINTVIISGDGKSVVDDIAKECGIDEYYAQMTPPEKFEYMEELKAQGHNCLMVGDGLNDAPSLRGAHVSMAPGTAIDMAQNAADIVFMGKGFSPVFDTYKIAVLTQKLVKQNFFLATLYNIIAIPLALAGYVTPLVAALAMSGSSLIVIGNSFRLKK